MERLIDIRNVLLDVDDTILDFEKGQRQAIFLACDKLGFSCTEEQYLDYDEINKKYWKMFERGEMEKDRLIFARFEEFFSKYGITADPVEMEYAYQAYLGDQYFYMEGAEEGLAYLKSKYNIYIVTNGLKHTQENRLSLSGIDGIADGIFISEAVGVGKPSVEYFDYVFGETGADRTRSIIVGDSLTSDIRGGKNAGIPTVWFNSRGKKADGEIKPDYEVRNWAELKELL